MFLFVCKVQSSYFKTFLQCSIIFLEFSRTFETCERHKWMTPLQLFRLLTLFFRIVITNDIKDFFKYTSGKMSVECVRPTKWYQYIFSVIVRFRAYYIMGHWGKFKRKVLLNTFIYFFGIFLYCSFYHFQLMKYQISAT